MGEYNGYNNKMDFYGLYLFHEPSWHHRYGCGQVKGKKAQIPDTGEGFIHCQPSWGKSWDLGRDVYLSP